MSSPKPVIFISYSHKDEPEKPRQDEIQWLSFVRTYLQPAVKHGVFDLWVDQHMSGGADWNPEIEEKLLACDIFILLVSANAMASSLRPHHGWSTTTPGTPGSCTPAVYTRAVIPPASSEANDPMPILRTASG